MITLISGLARDLRRSLATLLEMGHYGAVIHPTSRTYVLMALPRRLDDPVTPLSDDGGMLLPTFVGGGGDNLLCGECHFMVAQCVELENLRSQKLICPRCCRENVIPRVGDLRALGQVASGDAFSAPDRSMDEIRGAGENPVILPGADRMSSRENSEIEP